MRGIGKERAEKFRKLGIFTAEDLLFHFPRAYERRGDIRLLSDMPENAPFAALLTVATEVSAARIRAGMTVYKFRAFDESATAEIVFFNAPFVKQVFHTGSVFRFYGKAERRGNRITMTTPKYEPYVEGVLLDDFCPVYPLTAGLTSKIIGNCVKIAEDLILPTYKDPIPDEMREAHSLATLSYAIRNIHFPENEEALSRAMRRLAFDELFYFALGMTSSAERKKEQTAVTVKKTSLQPFLDLLPYELTPDQKNAVRDIYRDMTATDENGHTPPMTRILAGDVGSGKTVCAALAMYMAVASGLQCTMMAPTEILATQHYKEISEEFSALGYRVELLIGSTKEKKRKEILADLAAGRISVLVGTHALLSERVVFGNLGLVVTDEQHRFGVAQRAALKDKSDCAHLLVMSATPIPRSLALVLYGDLDVSRITTMPKGRMRVDTFVVDESYRDRLNAFMHKQTEDGGQCYVICPSVEAAPENGGELYVPVGLAPGEFEKDAPQKLKSAVEYAKHLSEIMPDVRVACLHGRMKDAEKDRIMESFAAGDIQILVSTTVIEVGINVPNATLMVVENADRFGLSQLHQLRGRVGRGKKKSYCVLVSDAGGATAKERLQVMRTTYDGYEIATRDLLLRGPGDFFSGGNGDIVRQSGGFTFRFASLTRDTQLLTEAFRAAKDMIREDPELRSEEHAAVRERLSSMLTPAPSYIS